MGSNKPYKRREFIKNILFGAGGLVFASSPLTFFPEKAEARRKRKRSKRLEEKLKIADFYFNFKKYSKKEADKNYEIFKEYFEGKVPPLLQEYFARTSDDTLYWAWKFMFHSNGTIEDYHTALLYLDLQNHANQGRHFDLKRAKYEPMYAVESMLLPLYYIAPDSKTFEEFSESTKFEKNKPIYYYRKGVAKMLYFLVDKGYLSNKTNHRDVSDFCIKMFSSSLFETYYPGSGKRLGNLFFHVDLDKKKEMIYDLIIPKITEHGTLDKLLEYKDNENLPLKERRELFYKGLINAHNLPLENQIEYMKRLWASSAITALNSAYMLGYLFVTEGYHWYLKKTYYDPTNITYDHLEKEYSLRKSKNNYLVISRGPPLILPYVRGADAIYF